MSIREDAERLRKSLKGEELMSIREEAERLKKLLEEDQKNPIKIAFFGQPGAGKSSLMNAIAGKKVADVSPLTDTTTKENAEMYLKDDMLLCDLPGYGTTKFPPNDFFDEMDVENFDLFLCVFVGKFKEDDSTFFNELKQKGKVCIFVRNKSDDIYQEGKSLETLKKEIVDDLRKQVQSPEKVFFTSCRKKEGISELNEEIENQLNGAAKEKYARSAKAFSKDHLERKIKACKKLSTTYAGMAAANALNPIPGADIAVDFGILMQLFSKIRESYGISDSKIDIHKEALKGLGPAINNIIKVAGTEGIILLLKRFGSQVAVKQFSKYIPIIGQAIAATAGFGITKKASDYYIEECHKVAEIILEEELKYNKSK